MDVEAVRFVEDPFEWSSITNRVGSLYHQWGWAEQSRRRVSRQLPHLTVDAAYLRIWEDDTLIAVPLILIDDIWYNAPRSIPMVISGPPIDPTPVIDQAADWSGTDIVVIDDGQQIARIVATAWELREDADEIIERRSFTPADAERMAEHLTFADERSAAVWFEAVAGLWQAGWDCRLCEYRRHAAPIGWATVVLVADRRVCVAAAHIEHVVAEWTSPR